MTEQDMDRGIALHKEIRLLNGLLKAADMQPYLDFSFTSTPGRIDETFTIRDEDLTYHILKLIKEQKERLEKEFKEI